jgi:L-cysteine S-thiosulfotransferase
MRLSLQHVTAVTLLALLAACSKPEQPQQHRSPSGQPMGEALFRERCRDCHKAEKQGGEIGPDLAQSGAKRHRRSFLTRVIREPSQVFPGTVMPRYRDLSAKQVDSLVDYLDNLK